MKTTTPPRSRELSEAAEHQMRMWALRMESQRRLEEQQAATATPKQLVRPYIAISRESGVDAGEIAKQVARQRNWKVFDQELLDYMVEHYHWSRIALEYVDERTASWFLEIFGKWLDQQMISQAEYVSRLGKIVLMAAQDESTVFVGRGAQFVLPRDVGLRVRIIDGRQQRIRRIAQRLNLAPDAAESFIDETDKGRADFIRRYFHRDVTDPHLYDLVISLEHTPIAAAAELIVCRCRQRFGDT